MLHDLSGEELKYLNEEGLEEYDRQLTEFENSIPIPEVIRPKVVQEVKEDGDDFFDTFRCGGCKQYFPEEKMKNEDFCVGCFWNHPEPDEDNLAGIDDALLAI
mgnify:CR=1 FL=1